MDWAHPGILRNDEVHLHFFRQHVTGIDEVCGRSSSKLNAAGLIGDWTADGEAACG
jgi:hypothetical protein